MGFVRPPPAAAVLTVGTSTACRRSGHDAAATRRIHRRWIPVGLRSKYGRIAAAIGVVIAATISVVSGRILAAIPTPVTS